MKGGCVRIRRGAEASKRSHVQRVSRRSQDEGLPAGCRVFPRGQALPWVPIPDAPRAIQNPSPSPSPQPHSQPQPQPQSQSQPQPQPQPQPAFGLLSVIQPLILNSSPGSNLGFAAPQRTPGSQRLWNPLRNTTSDPWGPSVIKLKTQVLFSIYHTKKTRPPA